MKIGEGRKTFLEKGFPSLPINPYPSLSKDFCVYRIPVGPFSCGRKHERRKHVSVFCFLKTMTFLMDSLWETDRFAYEKGPHHDAGLFFLLRLRETYASKRDGAACPSFVEPYKVLGGEGGRFGGEGNLSPDKV